MFLYFVVSVASLCSSGCNTSIDPRMTCCGSQCVILYEGNICCGNYSCNGVCYINETANKYLCLSNFDDNICWHNYFGISGIFIILALPNIIVRLISSACCQESAPATSFWINILSNFFIALIVVFAYCVRYAILSSMIPGILSLSMYFTLIILYRVNVCGNGPSSCEKCKGPNNDLDIEDQAQQCEHTCRGSCCDCCTDCCVSCARKQCCDPPNAPLSVLYELKSPVVTRDELITVVKENAMLPPIIQITGETYHSMGKNNKKILSSTQTINIPFKTWQEEGNPVYIPNTHVVKYRCLVNFDYENGINDFIEGEKNQLENSIKDVDKQYTIKSTSNVPGVSETVTASDGSCCVNCMTSCISRFFLTILMFLGYHSIYETIWRSIGSTVYFRSSKFVSNEENCRAKAGERDRAALDIVISQIPIDKNAIPLTQHV